MFEKIAALVAAAKSGDWKTAVKIALGLISDGVDAFVPDPAAPVVAMSAKSKDEVLAELEAMTVNPSATAVPWATLLPLLVTLLQQFLGKKSA